MDLFWRIQVWLTFSRQSDGHPPFCKNRKAGGIRTQALYTVSYRKNTYKQRIKLHCVAWKPDMLMHLEIIRQLQLQKLPLWQPIVLLA